MVIRIMYNALNKKVLLNYGKIPYLNHLRPELIMSDQKVEKILKNVFQLDENQSLNGVAPGSIPQWDSLGHVMLIGAVEKAFDIQFSHDEIAEIDSLHSLKKVVNRHVS